MRATALAFLAAFVFAALASAPGLNGLDVLAWLAALTGVVLYALAESDDLDGDCQP